MTLPPPQPPAAPANRVATVALVVGLAAVVLSFATGVFMLRVHPNVAFAVPVLTGVAAIAVGVAGIVRATRSLGRGMPVAVIAVVLGTLTLVVLLAGRIFAAEVLGFH